jgi:hypothetical protein
MMTNGTSHELSVAKQQIATRIELARISVGAAQLLTLISRLETSSTNFW